MNLPLRADHLLAVPWAALAGLQLAAVLRAPTATGLALVAFNVTVAVLFALRRPATQTGSRSVSVLAALVTLLPLVGLQPSGEGLPGFGLTLQLVGLAGMLGSLICLGRAFGIAPAHRGLATRGPYALVRHPLYACELISTLGYCVAHPSLANLLVWLALLLGQLARLRAEESLLNTDLRYLAYRLAVPWRLMPGVW